MGRPDRAGRHPRVRGLVRPRGRGVGPRPARRRRVRRRAARADRRHLAPADRRAGAAEHPGRRDRRSTRSSTPRTPARCTTRCCSTRARSPSPPPPSTPAPPSPAARGTPGSRPWSSTRSSARRPTRACCRARARWAGGRTATWPWCWAPRLPTGPSSTSSSPYAARRAPAGWTRCAPRRATGSSSCWAASPTRSRPRPGCSTTSATGPSWSDPSPPTWPTPTPRPAPPCRPTGPPAAGPTPRARSRAATCCPSGPWPATATRGATSSTRSTSRWWPPAAPCWRRWRRGSSTARRSRATARALFVHPNTVRYRLRQISDATGWSPTRPREAFALQLALILGRQSGRTEL